MTAQLGEALVDPSRLTPPKDREVREFVLTMVRDMGTHRGAGRGSFTESIMAAAKAFYGEVVQNLSPWKARPAKLPSERASAPSPAVAGPPALEEGIERAEAETRPAVPS